MQSLHLVALGRYSLIIPKLAKETRRCNLFKTKTLPSYLQWLEGTVAQGDTTRAILQVAQESGPLEPQDFSWPPWAIPLDPGPHVLLRSQSLRSVSK